MNRALAVTRMHMIDRLTLFALPIGILASAFAINLAIWFVVAEDGRKTGGLASIYCFVAAAAALAVVRGLPFAMGLGSSRRAFTAGTFVTGGILGVVFGTLCFVLQLIERGSDGWGLHGHFFWFSWFGTSWALDWLLFVVSLMTAFAVGALLGAVVARFQMLTVIVGGPLTILVGGGVAVLLTWKHWWGDAFGWFGDLTPATTTLWCAVLALASAAVSRVVLRRYRVG